MDRGVLTDSLQRETFFRVVGTFDGVINALLDRLKNVVEKKVFEAPVEVQKESTISLIKPNKLIQSESSVSESTPKKPMPSKKKKCKRCGSLFVDKKVL